MEILFLLIDNKCKFIDELQVLKIFNHAQKKFQKAHHSVDKR
jgi:hypothetical protein